MAVRLVLKRLSTTLNESLGPIQKRTTTAPDTGVSREPTTIADGVSLQVLSHGDVSARISPTLAGRITSRLDALSTGAITDSNHPLAQELRTSNCYGCVGMVALGAANSDEASARAWTFNPPFADKDCPTYQAMVEHLQAAPVPAAIVVGEHGHHAAILLGFDDAGNGLIFQKGNMGTEYPWELQTLDGFFQKYLEGERFGGHRVQVFPFEVAQDFDSVG